MHAGEFSNVFEQCQMNMEQIPHITVQISDLFGQISTVFWKNPNFACSKRSRNQRHV